MLILTVGTIIGVLVAAFLWVKTGLMKRDPNRLDVALWDLVFWGSMALLGLAVFVVNAIWLKVLLGLVLAGLVFMTVVALVIANR